MSISKITISNFQAITSATCELQPLTIFTGPNSSGKSSFINAINLFGNRILKTKNWQYPLMRLIISDLNNKSGDFKSLLNRNTNSSLMTFSYPIRIWNYSYGYDLDVTLTYVQNEHSMNEGILNQAIFSSKRTNILTIKLDKEESAENDDQFDKFYDLGHFENQFLITINIEEFLWHIGSEIKEVPPEVVQFFQEGYPVNEEDFMNLYSEELTGENEFYDDGNNSGLDEHYRKEINLIFNKVKQFFEDLLRVHLENKIVKLPAQRSSGQSLILDKESSYLIDILRDFDRRQLKNDATQIKFLNKWIHKFRIGTALKVRRVEGSAYMIEINQGNDWVNLFDHGHGITQLVPLILAVATYGKANGIRVTMCIEEPETNLHPNYQSLMADFLVDSMKLGINLVIETHSEYLIRKLQYLTAIREIKSDDTIIYYFDKGTPDKIEIENDGRLNREFGKGFYDEANNLAIELFRITSSQIN